MYSKGTDGKLYSVFVAISRNCSPAGCVKCDYKIPQLVSALLNPIPIVEHLSTQEPPMIRNLLLLNK